MAMAILFASARVVVHAQTQGYSIIINEQSFVPVQTDFAVGVPIDKIGKDTSNRPCARLKIHINRMTTEDIEALQFRTVGGSVVVMRQVVASEGDGLIVELTAKQHTRFFFRHPKYGDSNEVSLNLEGDKEYKLSAELCISYPIFISSNVVDAEVYLDDNYKGRTNDRYTLTVMDIMPGSHTLKIQHGSAVVEQQIEVTSTNLYFRLDVDIANTIPQYVVFEVSPRNAVVIIDKKSYVPDTDGGIQTTLYNGTYNYEVIAKDYHSEKGTFLVSGEKVEKQITLKPTFGWLSIVENGTLLNASIYIDDNLIGTTPINRHALSSGEHHIRIIKSMYKTYEDYITINEGEENKYATTLTADFANVTLTSNAGSDIYINGEYRGKSPWTGVLAAGTYIFEAKKEGHTTTTISKNIGSEPANQSYTLDDPKPIMGTINVTCSPIKVEILVDDVAVGYTPLRHNLIIGKHNVTLRKEGYQQYTQTVNVSKDDVIDINATLQEVKESSYEPKFNNDLSSSDDFEFSIGEVTEEIEEEEIFFTVEEMPKFRGGGLPEFRNWVQKNIEYPWDAIENGIQGNVVVQFVVGTDGKIQNFKILQSPDKSLSDATIKVLKKANEIMIGWKPGKQRGKPVKVSFTLPVSFKIAQ